MPCLNCSILLVYTSAEFFPLYSSLTLSNHIRMHSISWKSLLSLVSLKWFCLRQVLHTMRLYNDTQSDINVNSPRDFPCILGPFVYAKRMLTDIKKISPGFRLSNGFAER